MKYGALLAAAIAVAPASAQPLAGQTVFRNWCAPCHARVSGNERLPGTSTLAARYKGEIPAALEDRADLTPELVKTFVRRGARSMPPFRRTEISDADLDALARYLGKMP